MRLCDISHEDTLQLCTQQCVRICFIWHYCTSVRFMDVRFITHALGLERSGQL